MQKPAKKSSLDLRTVRQNIKRDLVEQEVGMLRIELRALRCEVENIKEALQGVKQGNGEVDKFPGEVKQ